MQRKSLSLENNKMDKYCVKNFYRILFLTIAIANTTNASWLPTWFSSTSTPIQTVKNEPTLGLEYSFVSWKKACEALPAYTPDAVRVQLTASTILSAQELENALNLYFNKLASDKELFLNKKNWVDEKLPEQLIISLQSENASPIFDPFVEKIVLKDKSIVAFHGDIHGDIHSLLAFVNHLQQKGFLKDFEIINPDFYMVFLGDYTDRGLYGPEVLYTILRLKLANPHSVFLVRGNHEDREQNKCDKRSSTYFECFWSQLEALYTTKIAEELFEKINKFYESMPLALYLGCPGKNQTDYILCCHGGIEMGFDPYMLLNHPYDHSFTKLGSLHRFDQLQKLNLKENESILNLFKAAHESITNFNDLKYNIVVLNNLWSEPFLSTFEPRDIVTAKYAPMYGQEIGVLIGFQWNDYEVDSSVESGSKPRFIRPSQGRGFVIGKTFNNAILALNSDKKNKVRGVFRAHQHIAYSQDPMMRRILNSDNLDFPANKGVGKLWISKEHKANYPHQLWDNIVCTFNVSPNTIYQLAGYKEDTYGLLSLGAGYENWRLDVISQKTVK